MIDHDRRQQRLMQQAEQDSDLEEMVARLVKEFERDMAERERKAREALEAAAQITDEDRARMEAEAQAQAEAEARAREEAAAAAQAEAEEVLAMIAAERAAQAARQAAIEAEEARRFHEALKKPEQRAADGAEDAPEDGEANRPARQGTVDVLPSEPVTQVLTPMADGVEAGGATERASVILPRRVHKTGPGSGETVARPPRMPANGSDTPSTPVAVIRRSLFGGRIALSVGGKGSKT